MNDFANLRRRAGLSQEELFLKVKSLGLNVSSKTIQRIEYGERGIWDSELAVFCKALNCSVDELLGRAS